jgi:hypothetical protein
MRQLAKCKCAGWPNEMRAYNKVNKLLFLSNTLYKNTIFKCESAYTDVISDEKTSDYAQISFGMENNIYDIYELDLALFTEYYRYIYTQNKIQNVDISEIYNDDIFFALKLNVNDVRSSEIKAGILYDLQNAEKVLKLEVKSRVSNTFVLAVELLHTTPAEQTLLSATGEQTRVVFSIHHTF